MTTDVHDLIFKPTKLILGSSSTGDLWLSQPRITITIRAGNMSVVSISIGSETLANYLDTDADPITPYTPQYPWSPATKKYVDDSISTTVASAYKYKWSVASYSNLPASGNTEGDVWNVTDTGMNYAWTWSAWDALGATVDLSNYIAKDNTTAFTPSGDYNPATKKYVDDSVSAKDWIEVNVATAAWTAAKVWTTTAGGYTPTKWDFLLVNFVSGCSVDNPTLNIDWSWAKNIKTGTSNANKSTFALWTTANSNIKALFYYDWTYYRCWSTSDSNTTYSAMSVSEWQTGTATSQRSMRADYLKQIIKYHAVSDTAYDSTWDWVTSIAPSKNAVYDKIESLSSSIPSSSATAPSNPIEWMLWYDTTNDVLKVYDWTNWNAVDTNTTYNAGEWIEIWTVQDYSAMQWPAPYGFHVPSNTEWQAIKDIWTTLGWWDSDWTNFWIALKLPFAGRRSYLNSSVSDQGTRGRYWSSSRSNETNAYYLYLGSAIINPQSYTYRSDGFSVRCFKNFPIIPTLSWTKLYWTSIESWWIFWNSVDWLISLSSDWQTWITIADKNLWATTVWNNWDTLSEANCGWYFQWGNNYMFPFTWTIANQSTTQVNANNYWPWNYYSSDTFIKYNWSWDSSDNWNLRWWVTWVITLDNVITNTGVLSVNGQTGNVIIPEWTNAKVFTISWQWDTTTGQAIYDYYKAWNTPFVQLNNAIYKLTAFGTNWTDSDLNFEWFYDYSYQDTTDSKMIGNRIVIFVTNDVVFDVVYAASTVQYLSTNANYQIPYTPQYAWSPATKKYVDDNAWIQNDTTWTTSTISQEWVWTKAEFEALSSYWDKIYNIIE